MGASFQKGLTRSRRIFVANLHDQTLATPDIRTATTTPNEPLTAMGTHSRLKRCRQRIGTTKSPSSQPGGKPTSPVTTTPQTPKLITS
jgi:hypothetical protein